MSSPNERWTIFDDGDRGYRITNYGDRLEARRRRDETINEFERRLAHGTLKELIVDYIAYLKARRTPAGTVNTYRSNFNAHILDAVGNRWLVDCDYDTYTTFLTRVLDECGAGRFLAISRTMGALAGYGHAMNRWPPGHEPFGGTETRIKWEQSIRRSLGVDWNDKGLITLEDCPLENEVITYGDFLSDAFAATFGEETRVLGRMPLLGLYTGTRIASTFALHADDFNTARRFVHVRWQVDRTRPWKPIPAGGAELSSYRPPLAPEKQGRKNGYRAALWGYTIPALDELLEEARANRGGWLFAAAPLGFKRPLDEYERFERAARKAYGNYRWTHHWGRHTYASTNLSPPDPGDGIRAGFGRSVHQVANYLGDRVKTVERTYWHPPSSDHGSWSDDRPGA